MNTRTYFLFYIHIPNILFVLCHFAFTSHKTVGGGINVPEWYFFFFRIYVPTYILYFYLIKKYSLFVSVYTIYIIRVQVRYV